jgi:HTH-type transcriptional regulator/antitoxin HigA
MDEIAVIDDVRYGELLAHALPRVIETDEENERLIAELERLDSRGKSPEEEKLAELLTLLIEQFERKYDLGRAEPLDALTYLMEERGLRQRDLMTVFGASSTASDVLNGKRQISKRHAKKLAEFFSVPASLFI